MKLCSIFCVWDDWDLLSYSFKNITPLVDGIIIIGSRYSNYGELSEIPAIWLNKITNFEPNMMLAPHQNEINKRNFGLDKAKQDGYTHFLMMDADEFYLADPFLKEKDRFLNHSLNGLVCASQVYFKSPKLTIGIDATRVTFIHKLTPELKFTWNINFPYAFEGKEIRIDPTRQLNIVHGVEWSNIIMHHYSWVRKDFEKKIRNSSARHNIEKSKIRQDLRAAKEGYYIEFYKKILFRATVDFKIPEFDVHENLQTDRKPLAAGISQKPRNK